MRRLGLIFCIYISIINGICNGFEIEDYRGFVFILAFVFFFYWSIITSDFFYNHKLLRWFPAVRRRQWNRHPGSVPVPGAQQRWWYA